MLVIRATQLSILSKLPRQQFVQDMMVHLRTHFPSQMDDWDDSELCRLTDQSIAQAAEFELLGKRQVCQFINLCAIYGWGFWKHTQHHWMVDEYLRNPDITNPQERIGRLVDQCLWRMEVDKHNALVQSKIDKVQRLRTQQQDFSSADEMNDGFMDKEDV